MSTIARVSIALAFIAAAVLGWGYWRARTHAATDIRIEDYALRTDRQAYGAAKNATIEFFDARKTSLAVARTVGAHDYLQASHPDAKIGNCMQFDGYRQRGRYSQCFDAHSRWAARWAPQVRSARVTVGNCVVNDVPVTAEKSKPDWWLWWVPLPHVGGSPLSYYRYSVAIDSAACTVYAPG